MNKGFVKKNPNYTNWTTFVQILAQAQYNNLSPSGKVSIRSLFAITVCLDLSNANFELT